MCALAPRPQWAGLSHCGGSTDEEMDKSHKVGLCFDVGCAPRGRTECFSEKIIFQFHFKWGCNLQPEKIKKGILGAELEITTHKGQLAHTGFYVNGVGKYSVWPERIKNQEMGKSSQEDQVARSLAWQARELSRYLLLTFLGREHRLNYRCLVLLTPPTCASVFHACTHHCLLVSGLVPDSILSL